MFKSASHGCFQPFAELREREIVVPDEKSCLCRNISLNDFWSDNCLTHFEQLKHGLPRYQNKHHQTAKQTKSPCTIQRESKGF